MPEIAFSGPEGRLEGRYHPHPLRDAPVALVLHPDPRIGGNMNHKCVHRLHYTFREMGFSVLRFNFRGVGRSQGEIDDGHGELYDAAAALDYLQAQHNSSKQRWVAGLSFGAYIAMQLLMRRPELTGFVSVSAPATQFDFSFLAPCPASGLFISGSADKVVPRKVTAELVETLRQQRGITIDHTEVRKANHFFEGEERLDSMARAVTKYVTNRLAQA